MKNKLLVLGAMVCLIAILAAGTLAYFTTNAVTHNVITSGEIDISIVEKGPVGSTPLPDGGFSISGAMPDSKIQKEVAVKNETIESAWVCVKLTYSIVGKDGAEMKNTVGETALIDYVHPENFADNWVQDGDFYYYKKPLAGNQTTTLLIEEVAIAPEMNNPYQECTVTVNVKAYAVQSKNNMPKSGNVLDVEGWPDRT